MPFELADNGFDVIFIDQEVVFHHLPHVLPFYCTVQDLLLVLEGDLGVRDEEGGDQGMGNPALGTKYTLDGKAQQDRLNFNRTFVMSIADQASLLPTGTLAPMELKGIYNTVINILRKVIAVLEENCYHIYVCCTRDLLPVLFLERQDDPQG